MLTCLADRLCHLITCFGSPISALRPGKITRDDCDGAFSPELDLVYEGKALIEAKNCKIKLFFCPDPASDLYFVPQVGDLVDFKGKTHAIEELFCQNVENLELIEASGGVVS